MPEYRDDLDPAEWARGATEFFAPLVPGQLGCVFDHSAKDLVVGHIDVTDNLIAGTGFLFAPAVVALADTCAAIGCGKNIPPDASFTTIELKPTFSRRLAWGSVWSVGARRLTSGAKPTYGMPR